jgi:hypothetical protein
MEEQLRALLLADPGVSAQLGTRIWWGRNPQGASTEPNYAILQKIGKDTDYHMQGPSGYVQSRVQIDVYSADYLIAVTAARSIIAKLSGLQEGIFQGIFEDTERDLPAADPGQVTNLFRRSVDFMVHHRSA